MATGKRPRYANRNAGGEVPVTTGSQDPAGAERGHIRAGHADREQVIEALKIAFVDGRLTKDELAARTGRALAARTRADLAALTADLPAESTAAGSALAGSAGADPALADPAGSPVPAIRRPMARAAVISGTCLAVAIAAMRLAFYLDPESGPPGPSPDQPWAKWCILLAFIAVIVGLFALGLGAATSVAQRRSRRQLPPRTRPGPGSRALDGEHQPDTGHDPVPPGYRTDETQTDLRANKSRPSGRGIPARTSRAPGGVRPAPGAA
jgi:Domain of unknown function (DUF1707)